MTTADLIAGIADLDTADIPAVLAAIAARMAKPHTVPEPQATRDATDSDRLLNVNEVARLLKYRPSYVYEMLRRGDLPAVRDRKFVRVRQSAVNEYIARHEQRGPLPLTISNMLSERHDWTDPEAAAQDARAHASRARGQNRGARNNSRQVGSRDNTDS
ncbi:MAG TPA: helix-turn-helix domain-containing protein [Candidatus Binataceae bacterium]|nr:helix-turn-helix domain-containing protein [Candidatus Binataceae bacterium]